MADRVKRLYRVTAVYADRTTRRDFQTIKAARHRRDLLHGAGVPEGGDHEWPASVTIYMSAPITFPNECTP